jgi:hypothetical protein
MNYHTPITQKTAGILPDLMLRGNEAVRPQKLYTKEQYPNLPSDLVKITGRDGNNIFIPRSKLTNVSAMDV